MKRKSIELNIFPNIKNYNIILVGEWNHYGMPNAGGNNSNTLLGQLEEKWLLHDMESENRNDMKSKSPMKELELSIH